MKKRIAQVREDIKSHSKTIIKSIKEEIDTKKGNVGEKVRQSISKSKETLRGLLALSHFNRLAFRIVGGNKTVLLAEDRAFPEMISAMKKAKRSINIEMYIFRDDEVGRKISKVLKESARGGVKVNILYDSFGSKSASSAFFEDMRSAGVKVAEHNSINPIKSLRTAVFDLNKRDHRKIIVIDGKTAFIGGMNFAKHYHRDWRDVMVKIEGPIVDDLQFTFFKQWQRFELRPLGNLRLRRLLDIGKLSPRYKKIYFPEQKTAGDQEMGIIAGSPIRSKRAVHKLYLKAIRNAKKEIIIETPYFVPTRKLLESMTKKAREGKQVKIVIADNKSSDHPTLNLMSYHFIKPLIKAGAKVYFYAYGEKIFHAKLAVVDRSITIVGSSNLDSMSFKHNYEINAVIFDKKFAEEAINHIKEDIRGSMTVTLKEISNLSAKERVISAFYWLIRGWL